MANVRYKWSRYVAAVKHAIGGAPSSSTDASTTVDEIINRALDFMQSYNTWSWLTKIGTLSLVNAQNYVALPDDLREIINLSPTTRDLYCWIEQVSPEELVRRRNNPLAFAPGVLAYVLAHRDAADATAAPTQQVLELGPVPDASTADALTITYRRHVAAYGGAGDDLKYPAIPAGYHSALLQLCRAFAKSTEEDSAGEDMGLATAELDRLVMADARVAGNSITPMRNIVDDWYGPSAVLRPHTQIAMPGDP